MELLPEGSHPEVRKELRNTKDKSSIKVLEFLLRKPADWSDRIPEAWGSRICIFKPESQMIPEEVTLKEYILRNAGL